MPQKSIRILLAVIAVWLGGLQVVCAQDSHYWSHQYGGRANLLTGAVVGSIDDPSAAYYNPAGLAAATEDEVFLGVQVFDFTNIKIETESGTETELDSDDLGRAPSFLGGVVPLGLGKHRFAYAVFKRHAFDLRVDGSLLGDNPDLFTRVTFDGGLSERWFGATWSYPLTSILSVGVSTFLARRQQAFEIQRTGQGLTETGGIIVTSDIDYYKYWHYRILWKAGLELDVDQISFGLTVTTPGIKVYGSGERILNEARAGSSEIGSEDLLTADVQEGVDVNYQSPISAAFGLTMTFDRRAVNVSVEAFSDIAPYNVLVLQPAFSQSTGLPVDNSITASSESVLNAAVGFEEFFSQRVRGFLSVSTDYSAAPVEGETNLSVSRWDLYHATGGATFSLGTAQFILGLGYSFGSEQSERIAAPEESGLRQVLAEPVPSEIEYQRFKVIFGFSLST